MELPVQLGLAGFLCRQIDRPSGKGTVRPCLGLVPTISGCTLGPMQNREQAAGTGAAAFVAGRALFDTQ